MSKEDISFNIRGKVYKLLEPKDTWSYKIELHFDDGSIEPVVEVGCYIFDTRIESEGHMNEVADDIKKYFTDKAKDQGLDMKVEDNKRGGEYVH